MSVKGEIVFKFKCFEVKQDRSAMKVGTDGVLLGSWASLNRGGNVLDIGTGTGLIALMVAQRTTSFIDAIEIDAAAFEQATENFKNSPWAMRLRCYHIPFQEFHPQDKRYDQIISNPPYFINAHKSESGTRNMARHTNETLTFSDLIDGVIRLLNPTGFFSAILPIREGGIFIDLCEQKQLHCFRITRVKTKADKPVKRMLLDFCIHKKGNTLSDELIIQNEDGSYTEQYINLTRDFYTHYSDKTYW